MANVTLKKLEPVQQYYLQRQTIFDLVEKQLKQSRIYTDTYIKILGKLQTRNLQLIHTKIRKINSIQY